MNKTAIALTAIISGAIAACTPDVKPTGIHSEQWGVNFESNIAEYRLKQALCYQAGIERKDCEENWLSALPKYRDDIIKLAHPTNGYVSDIQAEKTLAVTRVESMMR